MLPWDSAMRTDREPSSPGAGPGGGGEPTRRRALELVGCVVVAGLAGGCAVNPVTGRSELMLLSEAEELALGREAYPALVWQDGGPLQVDPVTHGYLEGIVRRLHAVSHRPGLPVDFTLHSASEPNAWAIPGHTAMNRGLLQALENEAQFAFIMGHELGHVAARHSAQRQSRGLLAGALLGGAGAVLGREGTLGGLGELVLGVGTLGASLLLLRYDRAQELEADRLGALYMARAGYEPAEALEAHRALNRAIDRYLANLGHRRGEPGPLDELLSTHPRHAARLEELEAFLRAIPPGERRREGDGRWAERWHASTAPARVLAPAYAHYDRARQALGRRARDVARSELAAARRLAEQAPFWALEGVLDLAEHRFGEARASFGRALTLYPGYQPALHGLGLVEAAEGRWGAAAAWFAESLRLRPGYTPSEYLLGVALARDGRCREAVTPFVRVARRHPDHPEVYGMLAQCYERLGDRAAAVQAWRAQLRVAPDTPLGREARRRLQVLGPGG